MLSDLPSKAYDASQNHPVNAILTYPHPTLEIQKIILKYYLYLSGAKLVYMMDLKPTEGASTMFNLSHLKYC